MGDIRDDVRQLVSQFADDWLGSDEWALLRALPPLSLQVYLHGMTTLKGSDEPLPARMRQLADALSPLSPLPRDYLEARLGWLVNDLASAAAPGETAKVVDGFVDKFLAPNRVVLHSFTLGGFRVTGLSGREPVELVAGWRLHPRGMPLDSHARLLVSGPEGDEAPTSLTRFADVPKGDDPVRYGFEGWLNVQLILEGLRLFAPSGVFVAQEDFSPDYPYVRAFQSPPAVRPTPTTYHALPAERVPELISFLTSWLPLSPSREPEPPRQRGRNRLYQALWHLRRAYDDRDWEHALLDAVSGMELLLVDQLNELSYRLAIRAGHLLFAHDPDRAGTVFADIRDMYDVRSCIAHGDREAAGKKAAKRWGAEGRSKDQAGAVCATTAVEYLRKAILLAAYFGGKRRDLQSLLDEKDLLNVKYREAIRKSLAEDVSNPLIRALSA